MFGNNLDMFQLGLDAAGMIPGIGIFADVPNALISLARGNYVDAGLSAAAAVPIFGLGAGATKVAKGLANNFDEAGQCASLLTRLWNGGCFVPGTLVTLSALPHDEPTQSAVWGNDLFLNDLTDHAGGTALLEAPARTAMTLQIPIEDVLLGARVPTKNPRPWEYDDSLPEPDEATWSKVTITADRRDGQIVDAEILRPTAWLRSNGLIPGRSLLLDIEELQIDGIAHVQSIDPCPPIAQGEGSVVTARFTTRQVDQVCSVTVVGPDGQTETITGTPIHPIWSLDRLDWVPLGKLLPGERLQAAGGEAIVESILTTRQSTPVYNLEVHGEHVYQVSLIELLVHNACHVDALNIGRHALKLDHNWAKLFGNASPSIADIMPYVDDVIENGDWIVQGIARGPGGVPIGEILQATHNGVYIRAIKDALGKIIVNNAGVL